MKHLNIQVGKEPKADGVVSCRSLTLRERLLTRLLGRPQKVAVLIPGDCVSSVSISEAREGGDGDG